MNMGSLAMFSRHVIVKTSQKPTKEYVVAVAYYRDDCASTKGCPVAYLRGGGGRVRRAPHARAEGSRVVKGDQGKYSFTKYTVFSVGFLANY